MSGRPDPPPARAAVQQHRGRRPPPSPGRPQIFDAAGLWDHGAGRPHPGAALSFGQVPCRCGAALGCRRPQTVAGERAWGGGCRPDAGDAARRAARGARRVGKGNLKAAPSPPPARGVCARAPRDGPRDKGGNPGLQAAMVLRPSGSGRRLTRRPPPPQYLEARGLRARAATEPPLPASPITAAAGATAGALRRAGGLASPLPKPAGPRRRSSDGKAAAPDGPAPGRRGVRFENDQCCTSQGKPEDSGGGGGGGGGANDDLAPALAL